MRKNISKRVILLCIFCVLAFLICSFLLSETIARALTVFSILAIAAAIFVGNVEKSGPLSILLMASPVFSSLLARLTKLGLADNLAKFYNDLIVWFSARIGTEVIFQLEAESSLVLTYWSIVAILYLVQHIYKYVIAWKNQPKLREKNYTEKCAMFCKTLRQRIDRINRETDWNESTFTPLDAEIEACINKKRKKKFDDLLKCLKTYRKRNTVFLVLGDPGAGKSVAMRKLALDLLDDVQNSGLVPVYIDLKKWSEPWNMNHLPSKKDLITFIISILKEDGDFSADDFVDNYFNKMLDNGLWYFIFDSFDEMPCLMGTKNCKELIDEISDLLYNFLTGPEQRGGVIASRLFRSPTETLRPTVTMTIQPFSDIKIKTMLKKYSSSSYSMDQQLFGKREDLVSLCRNPFYLSLLINYFKHNGAQLPSNQMALYSSFVEKRLNKCSGKIELEGMTVSQLREAARQLALHMNHSQKYGLECPIQVLYSRNDRMDWQRILNLLAYAKICRFGGENKTVSFVHRRFQEFFYIENILAKNNDFTEESFECIVKNSGFRDALVLYCEVADDIQARKIAEYCWDVIQKNISFQQSIHESGCRELVNTLYFMKEAFRNRRSAMSRFLDDFQKLVEDNLGGDDILLFSNTSRSILEFLIKFVRYSRHEQSVGLLKSARSIRHKVYQKSDLSVLLALANSMVLFDPHRIQRMVFRIFMLKNRWLTDVVMLNCRLMRTKLDHRIETEIISYFRFLPRKTFFSRYRNTDFSLSLSKSFAYVRKMHTLRLIYELTFPFLLLAFLILCISAKNVFISLSNIHSTEIIGILFLLSLYSLMPVYTQLRQNSNIPVIVKSIVFCFASVVVFLLHLLAHLSYTWLALGCIFIWDISAIMYITIPIFYDAILSIREDLKIFLQIGLVAVIITPIIIAIISLISAKIIILIYCCFVLVGIVYLLFTKIGRQAVIILFTRLMVDPFKHIYYYLVDRRWQKRQPIVNRIARSDLANNLQMHPTPKWRRVYIDSLLQDKVILTGMWPSDIRPHFDDDELDFKMMKLDCAEMPDLCKPY